MQKQFDDCVFPATNHRLKFDFYIPKQNYLIEFDGEQHYKLSPSSKWNDKCISLKERDKYKNEWAKNHSIPLIRIPYTHLFDLSIIDL